MKMKKLLCILLISVLVITSLVGCSKTGTVSKTEGGSKEEATKTAELKESDVPEYLNLESDLPIIKEGHNITLKIAVLHTPDFGKIEDLHFWNLVKQKMNLNYEVEQIFNRDEYVNLVFASNMLPDVMIGFNIDPMMQINYGMMEKQLLPLSKYINEKYMPNLYSVYEKYPEFKAEVTAPDGEIYTFGTFKMIENPSSYPKQQINTKWLKEAGLEYAKTLDEFVNIMEAFKSRGSNIIPLGGSAVTMNPFFIIYNSFGYITSDSTGTSAALRNGKAVIPAGDRELFGEVLKLLHDFYKKGYISRDFYTLDDNATKALASELRFGVLAGLDAFVVLPEQSEYQQYESFSPFTSQYNSEPLVMGASAVTTGGYAISSKCKYPEVAIRFANYLFSDEGSNMQWVGAVRGSENLLDGWGGWFLDENYSRLDVDRVENPGKWPNAVEYLRKRVAGFNMGAIGNYMNEWTWRPEACGLEPRNMYEVWKASPDNGDFWWRPSAVDYIMPYAKNGYPSIVFFTKEENERIVELKSVIDAHITAECAKFVIGERPVTDSELNAYFNELDALGFKEYLGLYEQAYENYLANLKK